MNAIVLPSGDQRTFAACIAGLKTCRTTPDSASIAYSSATYQLSSPSPGAARYASSLPSGDQSNSYTYMSAGDITRAAPEPAFTIASRFSAITEAITPVAGAVASVGPGTRPLPSIWSTAMLFPSGDHCGSFDVALEFADFARFSAPRLLHHVQLHLAVRIGIGEKRQAAILRPG